ncbi:MAG TPA: metalloendopeptidase [Rikenellaceae bacterium]|nr:metalloendopeptidase [Rikenellaceae bacterium]
MQRKNLYILFVFLAFALVLASSGCKRKVQENETEIVEEVKDTLPPMGFWPDSLDLAEDAVRNGETFTGLMNRLGLSMNDAMKVAQACDTVFDVRKMRAGNKVQAYYQFDTTGTGSTDGPALKYVVYERDKIEMVIFRTSEPFKVWSWTKPVESTREYADVTIKSSLWNDMLAAGISPQLIVPLSEIYAWSVDFFGLQPGDRFRVLYEQIKCDDEIIAVDTIYYAEFVRDGKMIPAIMFDQGDNGNLYWNEKGESLRKAFLKAPLKFTRISSGFSYHRKHPVTGKVRAHTAVDYAAPTGTPVMTIGDGTIVSAGWTNGGGNTVKVRHNSVYTTSYMHLSRYGAGIKAGARVRQGDVIGYVGSTGMSTGPHLDFRVWKNGSPINPLKMDSPPSEPIKPENKPALDSTFRYYRQMIDTLKVTANQ